MPLYFDCKYWLSCQAAVSNLARFTPTNRAIKRLMTGFVLLAVGLGTFAMALITKDEINRIAVMVAGAIFLVWGFALTPLPFQLLVELSILVPVSFICLRCLGCGSTR
jgi:hypothetical protein